MKSMYFTRTKRFLTFLFAPLRYLFGKHEAVRELSKLKFTLDDPAGRLDAPDLFHNAQKNIKFFGIPVVASGFSSFDEMEYSSRASLLRFVVRIRKLRSELRKSRRRLMAVPKHQRGPDEIMELANVRECLILSSATYHSAHETAMSFR